MLASVQGVYRAGRIELIEVPKEVSEETPVIVTFLALGHIDLQKRGITEALAQEIRSRLVAFSEDWDDPAMDIYDSYESNKTEL